MTGPSSSHVSVGCAGWEGSEAFNCLGPQLFHRALYFAIVLLYYSGARREEICGLAIEDIRDFEIRNRRGQTETWPCLMIRPNSHRRLKEQSVRARHPAPPRGNSARLHSLCRSDSQPRLRPRVSRPQVADFVCAVGRSPLHEFIVGLKQAIPNASDRRKTIHSLRKTFGELAEAARRLGGSARRHPRARRRNGHSRNLLRSNRAFYYAGNYYCHTAECHLATLNTSDHPPAMDQQACAVFATTTPVRLISARGCRLLLPARPSGDEPLRGRPALSTLGEKAVAYQSHRPRVRGG